jgi:hypothetical protein
MQVLCCVVSCCAQRRLYMIDPCAYYSFQKDVALGYLSHGTRDHILLSECGSFQAASLQLLTLSQSESQIDTTTTDWRV